MSEQVTHYQVWDRTVRLFHWVNVICVLCLIAIGVAILNAKVLGVTDDGKILLKTLHIYFGYVFAINLGWRIIWGFI
ncbi:MAG: cytochrome b/b6 domain-containing protein, partial [Gammaproteobacteria bacterium]|nr:cytochrome b/b6 domain-containing protein [Gammaproteobacteria bacterium]